MTSASWGPEEVGLTQSACAALAEVIIHGPLARAELARRLALSPPSLTKIARPLLDAGYIRERPAAQDGNMGRPSLPLEVVPERAFFIGMKLASDKLFTVLVDLTSTVRVELSQSLVRAEVDYVLQEIVDVVLGITANYPGVMGIGIGLAGRNQPIDSHVHHSLFLGWDDVPLVALLEERVGLPVVLANDVRALAAAEHWFGAATGVRNFALITAGAGIGCAIVLHDRVIQGVRGSAGILSHFPIDDRGPLCELGHRGCASAFATTRAITTAIGVPLGRPGMSLDEAAGLARSGHPLAKRVFDDAGRAVGTLVGQVNNILDVDLVILSGEANAIFELAAEPMASAVRQACDMPMQARIVVRPLTFSAWARGAAVVAIQRHIDLGLRWDRPARPVA
jgi:predicted NBD/HSP70 family sugar kinase